MKGASDDRNSSHSWIACKPEVGALHAKRSRKTFAPLKNNPSVCAGLSLLQTWRLAQLSSTIHHASARGLALYFWTLTLAAESAQKFIKRHMSPNLVPLA